MQSNIVASRVCSTLSYFLFRLWFGTVLQVLDIASSIYGLRWLRILFAREFDLQNTLRLWDAIFSDSVQLDLVDYVFVSLLCTFRRTLITKDMMEGMQLLMRPLPDTVDVNVVLERALHIRDPLVFPKPASDSTLFRPSPSHPPSQPPSRRASQPTRSTAAKSGKNPRLSSSLSDSIFGDGPTPEEPPNESPGHAAVPGNDGDAEAQLAELHAEQKKSLVSRIDELSTHNNTLQATNKHYGEKLGTHIDQLEDELMAEDRLPDDDVIFLALSGTKDITKILKGLKDGGLVVHGGSAYNAAQLAELLNEDIQPLSDQMEELGTHNNTLQAMNKFYAEKLGTHIEQCQAELLVADRLPDDDVIHLALSGLKEVKDILMGLKEIGLVPAKSV
jgi:hypothetical protein